MKYFINKFRFILITFWSSFLVETIYFTVVIAFLMSSSDKSDEFEVRIARSDATSLRSSSVVIFIVASF